MSISLQINYQLKSAKHNTGCLLDRSVINFCDHDYSSKGNNIKCIYKYMYQDCCNILNEYSVFRPIPSGSFSSGGVYRVGKGQMSEPQFTGCIQDITVYPEVLVAE